MTELAKLRRSLDKPTVDQIAKAAQADITAVCAEFGNRADPLGMGSSFPRMARLIAINAHTQRQERDMFEALHNLIEASRRGVAYDGDSTYETAIEEFKGACEAMTEWAANDMSKYLEGV